MPNPLPLLAVVSAALAAHHVAYLGDENVERAAQFARAQRAAAASRKPLLVVGRPKDAPHPCGDVTIDVNPAVLQDCPSGGQVADVRSLPFPPRAFGAAFASHVLEHLELADIPLAWRELRRVADVAYVAGPRRHPLAFLNLNHTSLVWQNADGSLTVAPLTPFGQPAYSFF